MKKITRITSVLLFSLFVLTACSKDDDGGTSAAGDGELTATVDGASFESFPEATTAVESNAGGVQTLTISGGVITGLIAQGYDPLTASIFGCFVHGRAADIAINHTGYEGLIAGVLVEFLGQAFLDLFNDPNKEVQK